MSSEVAIRVENVSKSYAIYERPRDRLKQFVLPKVQGLFGMERRSYFREFWALKDASFEVKKGETVGVVGRNGSGKSTLLQIICGTLDQTNGTVQTNGRIAALLELGSGFNPEFTGRENIYMNAAVLGLTESETAARLDDLVGFAEIGDFIDQPVKTYSSGMAVRLAFAGAVNMAPEILIVDEALAVGDAAFQRKCMRKINELCDAGTTLLFVSHDTETVKRVCRKALYLARGSVVEFGAARQTCISYERDLFGGSLKSERSKAEARLDPAEGGQAVFDEDLLRTSEKAYGDDRAQILDVAILNQERQRTNILAPNAAYIISYRAVFSERVALPVFGMMVTNREGMCIFGVNTQGHEVSRRQLNQGDEVAIEFHIVNHLGSGLFYLTCGVHVPVDNGDIVYLHRRIDVAIFRVSSQDGLPVGGVVNLNPVVHVFGRHL